VGQVWYDDSLTTTSSDVESESYTHTVIHPEMPSGSHRPVRAKRLVRLYMKAKKEGEKRLRKRKAKLRRVFQHLHSVIGHTPSLDSCSSLPDMSVDTGSYNPSTADSEGPFDEWDNLFRTGWRGNYFFSSEASSKASGINLDLEESLPDFEPAGSNADNDEGCSSAGSFDSEILDVDATDADDKMSDADSDSSHSTDSNSESDIFMTDKWCRLHKWVFTELIKMYANHYELPWAGLLRGPSYLCHVLVGLKDSRSDHFRQQLCINPTTFDALVAVIQDDPVFMNNSNNPQMAVEEQLAITLFRFGRDGNGSGLQDVANWAGVAKGTVTVGIVQCKIYFYVNLIRKIFQKSLKCCHAK
jgi:hypothetical protein